MLTEIIKYDGHVATIYVCANSNQTFSSSAVVDTAFLKMKDRAVKSSALTLSEARQQAKLWIGQLIQRLNWK